MLVLRTTYVLRVPYSCGVVLVFLVLVSRRDAIFLDEPIKHMEEDGVGQSHANGIIAAANRFGEIREEHICKGRVYRDDVCSGLLGQSMRRLERLTLIVICAAVEVWYFFNFRQKRKERCGIGIHCEESIRSGAAAQNNMFMVLVAGVLCV